MPLLAQSESLCRSAALEVFRSKALEQWYVKREHYPEAS